MRSHAHLIAAADFFTTEVWTVRRLVGHFALFVIAVAARRVHIAGTTTRPTSAWRKQIARNPTDCEKGGVSLAASIVFAATTRLA